MVGWGSGRQDITSVCGESGDVQGVTVESWKERLPELMVGYKKEDVWNMMRLVFFGVLCPIVVLDRKGKRVREVKRANTE